MSEAYFLFDGSLPASELGEWSEVAGEFDEVLGYSYFGDFFLLNSKSRQCAIMYTMPPELAELKFYGHESFVDEFLRNEMVRDDLLQVRKAQALMERLGPLKKGQVYIPEPYPFLGGDLSIESYAIGDVWVFADILGQLQLGVD